MPETESRPHTEQMKSSKTDMCRFLIENLSSTKKSIPLATRIVASAQKGEQRCFGKDVLQLNEYFGTNVNVEGEENIPKTGGAVIVISHATPTTSFPGWGDKHANPFWWAAGLVTAINSRREKETNIRPIAHAPVGTKVDKLWRKVLDVYQGFPVNPLAPKEALRSLDQAAEAAKEGDLIIISPEGETHTQLTSAKRGVARLAKSERPFIPITFTEEQSEEGFSHHVLIGTPIEPPKEANSWSDLPSQKRKVLEQGFADLLMSSIAQLMPEDQRGKYK